MDTIYFSYHVRYKRYLWFHDQYAKTEIVVYGYYGNKGKLRFTSSLVAGTAFNIWT
jgi:hypothetical protein